MSKLKCKMAKRKWRNLWDSGKTSSERKSYFFVLIVPAFVEKAVVPERNLLEKWGTHRG